MRIHGLQLALAAAVFVTGAWSAPVARAQDSMGGVDKDKMAYTDLVGEFQEARQNKSWFKFREAGEAFHKKYPKHFGGCWLMAESYEAEGNPSAALPWYVKASDIDPTHFMAAFKAGTIQLRYKDSDPKAAEKGMPYLERAVEARKAGKGLSEDDTQQKLMDFGIGLALIDGYWALGEKQKPGSKKRDEYRTKVRKLSEVQVSKDPLSSIPCWYLGVLAEDSDNRAKAIDLYKKGKDAALQAPFNSVFHMYGLEDKRNECARRARFLDETTVRYGEITDVKGLTIFKDPGKEVEVWLPHPKLLKLKKGQRSPWVFMFPKHEAKAGSVITHIATAICQSSAVGGNHQVRFDVYGGAHTLNLNTPNAGSAKLIETPKAAETFYKDWTHRNALVDLKDDKAPRKQTWGKGYKGYAWSFTGKYKEAVDNYKKEPKKWRKPIDWENHCYMVKGKKLTFWVRIQTPVGFWKKKQREIQFMLKQLKLP